MLDFPGPWTGSSTSTHPPTGQPVRHATFQHHLADWSIRLALRDARHRLVNLTSSRLAPARRLRRPTHPRPPSQLGSPSPPCRRSPEGEPLWHHRATRRLPGVGYPPRRGPRPPPARAGEVHNRPRDTAMPPSSPCLDSTCMPASRGAHCAPTPVRERRAPCPVHLAQSCLSTYSPTPSASRMVKVV